MEIYSLSPLFTRISRISISGKQTNTSWFWWMDFTFSLFEVEFQLRKKCMIPGPPWATLAGVLTKKKTHKKKHTPPIKVFIPNWNIFPFIKKYIFWVNDFSSSSKKHIFKVEIQLRKKCLVYAIPSSLLSPFFKTKVFSTFPNLPSHRYI